MNDMTAPQADDHPERKKHTRWTPEQQVALGLEAASHMYHGMSELNAFRMVMTKLPAELQRRLDTIQRVPDVARATCASEYQRLLAEGRRVHEPRASADLKITTEQRLAMLEEQFRKLSLTSAQTIRVMTERLANLEDMVLDMIGDAPKAVHQRVKAVPKLVVRVGIIGIKPSQQRIIERDFPTVTFVFVDDGKRSVSPSMQDLNLVIVTRWNSGPVYERVKGWANVKFVEEGMTSIKDHIAQALKLLK